jgi:hypothetical protein
VIPPLDSQLTAKSPSHYLNTAVNTRRPAFIRL